MVKETESDGTCDCGTAKSRGYARYYDMPDGCDIPTKVMVATRYGVLTGLIMSTYDVLMYSQAVGLGKIMQRYMVHTLPLGMMGATFAVVSNGALHARMQDDRINYFIGGAACGPILAAYLGSKHAVLLGGLFLGAIGYIKKTAVEEGWCFYPDVMMHRSFIDSWRRDYTVAKDPGTGLPDPKCWD